MPRTRPLQRALSGGVLTCPAQVPVAEQCGRATRDDDQGANEKDLAALGKKESTNTTSSNAVAARSARGATPERRHVKKAVVTNVLLHARAMSAARGEVPGVVNQALSAAENAASPTTPAAANAAATG